MLSKTQISAFRRRGGFLLLPLMATLGVFSASQVLAASATGEVTRYKTFQSEDYASAPLMAMGYQTELPSPGTPTYVTPTNPIGSVELTRPQDLQAPTFASSMNGALMSPEMMTQIEGKYTMDLRNFESQYGYYSIGKDSRSSRPIGWTEEYEIQVHREMARSVREYMILRGIPKYLESREDTKKLGQNYAAAMKTVANASSVKIQTRNNWTIDSGINPLTTQAWLVYTNKVWKFESADTINTKDPFFLASKHWGRYTAETTYHLSSKVMIPSLMCALTRRTNGGLSSDLPVFQNKLTSNTVTRVMMNYSF